MLGQLESGDRAVIADMEAGLGLLTRMPEDSLDHALLVANPSIKSIEVVRRALEIIADRKITASTVVVGNRIRNEEDAQEIREALHNGQVVMIPEDPEVRAADFHGLSPIDAAPDSSAVRAALSLAAWSGLAFPSRS